jgi:hypothetical protein
MFEILVFCLAGTIIKLLTALSFILLSFPLPCPRYDLTCVHHSLDGQNKLKLKWPFWSFFRAALFLLYISASADYVLVLEPFL